jgi:hypothetical protein
VKLGSITQAIREEISKLNQVLHLLEGGAEDDAGQGTRQNISGWQKKNCGGPKSKVGEDQGREVEEIDWCRLRCRLRCDCEQNPAARGLSLLPGLR